MVQLHYLNNSRSHRILWLLETLEINYDVIFHERDPKTEQAPESLKKIHPLGKAPIIQDGEKIVAESAAIVEYLICKAGNTLKPEANSPEHENYIYWMHFAEGSAMPLYVMNLIFNRIEQASLPWYMKWLVLPVAKGISQQVKTSYIHPNVKTQLQFIENNLAKNTWFCGNQLTGADIMMSFPLEAAQHSKLTNPTEHPCIHRYVERIHSLPDYQKALTKSQGGYQFAELKNDRF